MLKANTVQLRRAHRVMHYAPNYKVGHPERSEGSAFFCALNNIERLKRSRSFASLRMTQSFFFARSRLASLTERRWV
jgi:IS4 transposase